VLLGTGLAFVVVVCRQPGGLELVISPFGGGEPIVVVPLEPGERFTLHYTHSVDRAPIWEDHSVDSEGNIYIEEERFVMFGAGMGHVPGRGTLTSRGPLQVIENIHQPIGDFVLRVGGEDVNHTLIWRGTSVCLSRLTPGRAMVVRARVVSLPSRLWRGLAPPQHAHIGGLGLAIGDWKRGE